MRKYIAEDLKSIYELDFIENAQKLNSKISDVETFCANMQPMYFTGKIDAKTVFIMLNPGAENKAYRFSKKDKEKYENFENYYESYLDYHQRYGEIDFERIDNFDLKQAAFLYYFKNTGISIPESFWDDTEKKKIAKRNVLLQKLQLELVPYPSRTFSKLFDTKSNAKNNYSLIKHDIVRLFEIIASYEREHVLFGSKQFLHIFNAINEINDTSIKVIVGPVSELKIGKLTLRMNNVKINFNNKIINAKIIHSFASQALPNAFVKMSEYGRFCFNNNTL